MRQCVQLSPGLAPTMLNIAEPPSLSVRATVPALISLPAFCVVALKAPDDPERRHRSGHADHERRHQQLAPAVHRVRRGLNDSHHWFRASQMNAWTPVEVPWPLSGVPDCSVASNL